MHIRITKMTKVVLVKRDKPMIKLKLGGRSRKTRPTGDKNLNWGVVLVKREQLKEKLKLESQSRKTRPPME